MMCERHRCLCHFIVSDGRGDVYVCVLGGELLVADKVAA